MTFQHWMLVGATVLTLLVGGTYTYRAATLPEKVPHAVTWALLTLLAGTAAAVQFAAGAGTGALVLLLVAILNVTNCLVGWRKGGRPEADTRTLACAGLAVAAIVLWRVSGNATVAAGCLTVASLIAFAPTVLRTWHLPEQEVQGTYWVNTVRYLMATLAVETYSWATMLFPGAWIAVNALFSLYHFYCLRRVAQRTGQTALATG
jgi:hypothetical protein